ncbi:site-specific integrase [Flavobacteriales bacterium]|nr:site-specific integrase [Flavobacteriales bacterium]
MKNELEHFKEILVLKRYSKQTIDSYLSNLHLAQVFFNNKSFLTINEKEWFNYVFHLVNTKKIAASTQRQIVGSINLFYKEMYSKSLNLNQLSVSQRENKLPPVLSAKEVKTILSHTYNIKHKSLLSLLYGSGLRIGELLDLRLSDIDSERMTVRVNQGKGKKDRLTILSHNVLKVLRKYFIEYKPKVYLFEGQNGGKYSASSARNVLKQSMKRANINKPATLHTLRHSFATHLLENGVGIAHIQKLLGHHNIKTTLIYTHIANDSLMAIKSPLD